MIAFSLEELKGTFRQLTTGEEIAYFPNKPRRTL